MLTGIVGLGLIGGSFAKAYAAAGHEVAAEEICPEVFDQAVRSGCVGGRLTDGLLPECDLILICTYPAAAVAFMEERGARFGEKPVVIDCCGTKRAVTEKGAELARRYGFTYAGGHPMAGTQFSGFGASDGTLFQDQPMVIVPPEDAAEDLPERIRRLLAPAGFSHITVTTAEKHDAVIAYTSQLAHVLSSAYIKSPTAREHAGMSAGSYRDMTRVARLSADMWTELCMDDRDNLSRETDLLIRNLAEYRDALRDGDAERLRGLFAEGDRIKREVDG